MNNHSAEQFIQKNYSQLLQIAQRIARHRELGKELLHEAVLQLNNISNQDNINRAFQNEEGKYYLARLMSSMVRQGKGKPKDSFYCRHIQYHSCRNDYPEHGFPEIDQHEAALVLNCIDTIVTSLPGYYGKLWYLHFDLGISLRELSANTTIPVSTLKFDYLFIKNKVRDELTRCTSCDN